MKSKSTFVAILFLLFFGTAYGVQISVPVISAESGATIVVEISLDNAAGLAGADIVLEYDPDILDAKATRTSALTWGFLMAANMNTPGRIIFAMARLPGITEGSGAILAADFEIKTEVAAECVLSLSDAELFNELGEDIDVTIVNGSLSVKGIEISASGELAKLEATDFMYGTHGLFSDGSLAYALESSTVNLDQFVGDDVIIHGNLVHSGLDGGPPLVDVVEVEVVEPPGPPVVREHIKGEPILFLEAAYDSADVHGYVYIDIWKGSIAIETGMFLEFQVAMFSGNPAFCGSVDIHTSDGLTLGDLDLKDQNGVSADPSEDLSKYAKDEWYHRIISLDALAGKTLDGIMIGTNSDDHNAGMIRVYVDNIQITDGEYATSYIWGDEATENTIPIAGGIMATGTDFAGVQDMINYSVSIVTKSVTPAGKLVCSWGGIKNGR